ncbi:MAG: hypothetical protein ACNA8L_12305 [Luteolibacter sp.]
MNTTSGLRKPRSAGRRGFLLVETTISMSILVVIGLVLLKLSLNILYPRQWTMQQVVSDAYMTYERAYAERAPYNDAVVDGSPWPLFPEVATTEVEMGRLPGGRPIMGSITRTRIPDPNNFPIDGGDGTITTNPANMKVWRLQSIVAYEIGGRRYLKSRTVIRSQ